MKTFNDLQKETTPEMIKEWCKLAEGFEFIEYDAPYSIIEYGNSKWFTTLPEGTKWLHFPTLIHRAVWGWNSKLTFFYHITPYKDGVASGDGKTFFEFKDYQPCHLTVCEMALLDCLLEILNA